MSENKSREQSGLDEMAVGEWMLPSDALKRFEPPAGMVIAATAEKEVGRYGFRIGTLGLLIKQGSGSEVMQVPAVWTLPGAPPWLLGLINLRGNLVPLFELRMMLGLGQRAVEDKPMVLVFDQGDKAVGILIDDFPKPLFALSQLPNLPQLPTALAGHVQTGYVKDDMIWLEFDQHSFFEAMSRNTD